VGDVEPEERELNVRPIILILGADLLGPRYRRWTGGILDHPHDAAKPATQRSEQRDLAAQQIPGAELWAENAMGVAPPALVRREPINRVVVQNVEPPAEIVDDPLAEQPAPPGERRPGLIAPVMGLLGVGPGPGLRIVEIVSDPIRSPAQAPGHLAGSDMPGDLGLPAERRTFVALLGLLQKAVLRNAEEDGGESP
jgi:hypothetical protein